jgi:hypothetical protein
MLYCDLFIGGSPVWYGKRCENGTSLNYYTYQGFSGQLCFVDMQGYTDPVWTGLGTRYQLMYFQTGSADAVSIPIQAVPSQQFDVTLNNQLCTISIYERPA